MATYLKQIEQALTNIIRKEDIHWLTASLLRKLEADAFLKMEYEGFVAIDKEKLTGLINQFWRAVLNNTPFRLNRNTPSLFRALPHPDTQNWLDLCWETVDENFSGLLADIAKAKVAFNIHALAGSMNRFLQNKPDLATVQMPDLLAAFARSQDNADKECHPVCHIAVVPDSAEGSIFHPGNTYYFSSFARLSSFS